MALGNLLSSATSQTNQIPAEFTNPLVKLLNVLMYILSVVFMGAIIFYGAQLIMGNDPDKAKRRIGYAIIGFVIVYMLPKLVDWLSITGS